MALCDQTPTVTHQYAAGSPHGVSLHERDDPTATATATASGTSTPTVAAKLSTATLPARSKSTAGEEADGASSGRRDELPAVEVRQTPPGGSDSLAAVTQR